jgi:hypothetical protein
VCWVFLFALFDVGEVVGGIWGNSCLGAGVPSSFFARQPLRLKKIVCKLLDCVLYPTVAAIYLQRLCVCLIVEVVGQAFGCEQAVVKVAYLCINLSVLARFGPATKSSLPDALGTALLYVCACVRESLGTITVTTADGQFVTYRSDVLVVLPAQLVILPGPYTG